MSHSELLQVVDEHTGEPTGEHVPRHELIAQKMWCRSTNIFILNSQGQILCHQRSLNKERYPGVWSTHFGGHIVKDESFKVGAMKELEEELGIKVNAFQLIPWRTSRKDISRSWMRDFLTIYDGPIEDLAIQVEEIEQVKWFSVEEIMEQLDVEGSEAAADIMWLAGSHDLAADYQCMRAVLTATIDAGIFGGDFKPLRNWHPLIVDPKGR